VNRAARVYLPCRSHRRCSASAPLRARRRLPRAAPAAERHEEAQAGELQARSLRAYPGLMTSTDQRLRALERQLEAAPDDLALLEELIRAYPRAGVAAPVHVVRRRPRWRRLVDFVARFYVQPIEEAGGNTEAELCEVEARLGTKLPVALREWYRFVGNRLEDANQDRAVPLESLRVSGDAVAVWRENQGCWSVGVPLNSAEEDPEAVVSHGASMGPISEALQGLLLSDTLVGALSHAHRGPLGPLSADVAGGHQELVTRWGRVQSRYPVRPEPPTPFFEDPYLGDDDVVIRGQSFEDSAEWVMWMTASGEARQTVRRLLGSDGAADRTQAVLVALEGLRGEDFARFVVTESELCGDAGCGELHTTTRGTPGLALLQGILGPQAKVAVDFDLNGTVVLGVRADDSPQQAFDQLRHGLPDSVLPSMRAGVVIETGGTVETRPLWPPESESFSLPSGHAGRYLGLI